MSLVALHRRLVDHGPRGAIERLLWWMLVPCSWLYGLIGLARYHCYRKGLFASCRPSVPVISVGNLAVGGTGKTPAVDYIVKRLLLMGHKVAVVSRGYGGDNREPVAVVSRGGGPLVPASLCGDEPYLLSQRNPDALVLVAPRRATGIRLAVEQLGAQVVVLDDGFQHLAVQRDLDIVLLDAKRPLGNKKLLPAGLLREFPSALKRADLLVLTRSEKREDPHLPIFRPLLHCRHVLAGEGRSLSGETLSLDDLFGKKCVAFAGIADPQNFFSSLSVKGLELVETVPFEDHVPYGPQELDHLEQLAQRADCLITTEKDGVKIQHHRFSIPCYQVPVSLEFMDQGPLEQRLESLFKKEI